MFKDNPCLVVLSWLLIIYHPYVRLKIFFITNSTYTPCITDK